MAERCNLNEYDREKIFNSFDENDLTADETELMEDCFHKYVFYQPARGQSGKRIFQCSNCSNVWFGPKQYNHNTELKCPHCRADITLKAIGYINRGVEPFGSLYERHNFAVFRPEPDGAITVKTGEVNVHWRYPEDIANGGLLDDEDGIDAPIPCYSWFEQKRYYFDHGLTQEWKRKCYWEEQYAWFKHGYHESPWAPMKTVTEPFQRSGIYIQPDDGFYHCIGLEYTIENSFAKYCQLETYMEGMPDYNENWRGIISYLSAYAIRPKLEMLVKLGHIDIVKELINLGYKNSHLLDWKASSPADFFRMTKQEYKKFRAAKGNIETLRTYHSLDQSVSFDDYQAICKCYTQIELANMRNYAKAHGLDCMTILRYLGKHSWRPQLWNDYIQLAEQLGYDLGEQTVLLPKDLPERHDRASETIAFQQNLEEQKKYMKRYKALKSMYEFSYDGLKVVVPRYQKEIVQEGLALKHCVGGYAPRHMEGRAVILFLRKEEDPLTPFVTIEMDTKDKTHLIQIHGYRNELDGAAAPALLYKEFLKTWLDWVRTGSMRTANGTPIIKTEESEEMKTA